MIGLQAALLLLLGVCCSASDLTSNCTTDCSTCEYHNNIGFVAGEECHLYYMCIKNPYTDGSPQTYRIQPFCCAEGLSWNQEHLTCVRDSYCIAESICCPEPISTTDFPCPNYEGPTDDTFFSPGYELQECPYGTRWSQKDCTCVFGAFVVREPCTKLLHFTFNNTYDSDSCYNFAKGDPYGSPLANGTLCLNGEGQYLQIPFLNNWFAWNPQARTFTVCVWVLPAVFGQTAAILSTNCDMVDPQSGLAGSVLDILLVGGQVRLNLGNHISPDLMGLPTGEWTRLCVTFDDGEYNVYWNDLLHYGPVFGSPHPPFPMNSHSAATLGYKDDNFGEFNGYIDDFCFWNEALTATGISGSFADRPVISYQ